MAAGEEHVPATVRALLTRLWSPGSGAPGAVVRSARQARRHARPGQEHFFVLQTGREPRMLLPVAAPVLSQGLVTAGQSLRVPHERVLRQVLGVALRTGLPQRLAPHVVTVERPDAEPLLEALRREWTPRVAAVGFSVRRITPNHKPTFVAVDARGRALGYGKVGWDARTRTRVEVESAMLGVMAGAPVPGLRTCAVVADFAWQERQVIVSEPLPETALRFPRTLPPPTVLVEHALAGTSRVPVEDRAAAFAASAAGRAPAELADALQEASARVVSRWAGCELPTGVVHGDWVPWNLALEGDAVWAWDWEHARRDDVPALDLAHWHLQVERLVRDVPLVAAVGPALVRLREDGARLGLSADTVEAVGELGLLQMAARSLELGPPAPARAQALVEVLTGVPARPAPVEPPA